MGRRRTFGDEVGPEELTKAETEEAVKLDPMDELDMLEQNEEGKGDQAEERDGQDAEPEVDEAQEQTTPMNSPDKDVGVNALPRLSSFDILIYAHLKEELVNTSHSSEAKHLESCKNLMWFVSYMDLIIDYRRNTVPQSEIGEEKSLLQKSKVNRIGKVQTDPDFLRRLLNDELRQHHEFKH